MSNSINRRSFLGTSLAATGLGAAAASSLSAAEKQAGTESTTSAKPKPIQNEKILHARKVALDILKPTPKQLEHGLQLHADSLVFDSYGFAPRAAIDGDKLAAAINANASTAELQDLREDMGMTRCVTDPAEQREFKEAFDASGVTCIFQNAGEEGQDPLRLIKRLARFTFTTDMLADFVPKAVTPDDIVQAKKEGRHCLYLTGNGVPLTQQWETTTDEMKYMRIFFQLGIRMMHMTYNRRNMLGDGCAEPANAGLSDFGRTVVGEMNRLGIIPDVAHSGWQTSLETALVSEKPVVASHTTCASLHHHIRSKPDNVIKAIVDTGGLIGICCIPRYLGGSGDINRLLDHIDYVVKKYGIDHIAIGTDVAYSSRNGALESKKVPKAPRSRTPWRSLWPPDSFRTTPEMSTSVSWTNWPLFTVGLVQRGYSDADIQKIIGGNMLRVCQESIS
ncbi:Membrane dipeptidase (Peptidase family M19) [Gimesia alba]|uniref:Membrane dipeptidase (Peptidase family M19) n=1 Tax=Gimesia alba TaxID=2527973 RepID=A0A517RPU0_9PLAN|nr:membrane dipeptidase [Gimesia alba]QDT45899.1 Membrane dipeptidase (Peptidase family M19) [Gimesia alba]